MSRLFVSLPLAATVGTFSFKMQMSERIAVLQS